MKIMNENYCVNQMAIKTATVRIYDVYVIIIIEMQIKSNIFVFCLKQNSAWNGMVVKLISPCN